MTTDRIIGYRNGKQEVTMKLSSASRATQSYVVTCDCGEQKIYTHKTVRNIGPECSTCKKEKRQVVGKTFGLLTVKERIAEKGSAVKYRCQCVCGKTTEVRGDNLFSGRTKTCGNHKTSLNNPERLKEVHRKLQEHALKAIKQMQYDSTRKT